MKRFACLFLSLSAIGGCAVQTEPVDEGLGEVTEALKPQQTPIEVWECIGCCSEAGSKCFDDAEDALSECISAAAPPGDPFWMCTHDMGYYYYPVDDPVLVPDEERQRWCAEYIDRVYGDSDILGCFEQFDAANAQCALWMASCMSCCWPETVSLECYLLLAWSQNACD